MPSERKSAFGNADDFGACMKKEDASVLRTGPQAASSCVVALISLASWLRSLTDLTTPLSLSFTTGPVAASGGDTHRPKREMKHHVRAMSPVLFSCLIPIRSVARSRSEKEPFAEAPKTKPEFPSPKGRG